MERSRDMMKNFEAALKRTNTRKPPQIYTENVEEVSVMPYSERHYSANDVLLNISKQLTSLQNADSIRKDLNINHKMDKHKKCALIPVNMLSLDDNFPDQRIFEEENCFASNKFETQCVSDTQLINIVVNAEKMVIPKGDTQEFENSFCEQLVQKEEASKNLVDSLCYNDRYDKEFELVKDLTTPIHSIIPNVPSTSKSHNSNEGNLAKNYSTNILDAQKDENENDEIDIIVQNVNIIEENGKSSSEVTQGFENSFCDQHVGKEEASKILTNSLCYYDRHDKDIELVTDLNIPIPSIILKVPSTSTSKDHNVNEGNQAINYSTNILGTQKETDIEVQNVDKTQENVKNSPVINYIKPISLHSSSVPLIYTLDAFENFAALAFPVIEKNSNFEAAQYVINSQIIDKELCLGNHIKKSTLQKEDRPISPVLSIKMNSTSTLVKDNIVKKKLWKDPDKSIVLKQGISVSIEKEVKSFEDEILFSSDEEKDFQELPFTCAIETSFNNQPDILNKTMYVGFQTASNKSIQINADSFSKAKNILEDVDINNHKLTLTELVAMCNIGNINNVSQLKKGHNNNNKNEVKSLLKDITNINDFVVNNKPKESIEGTNTIMKEPKSSPVLQTSNRKCEINFELVNMANEMKFDIKSTDSNHKYSKIITAIGKNLMNNRDLLEFHTASNKTIKLTEKALARCRQVFVDSDFDEKYDQTESENTRCYTQLNYTPKEISDFKENEVRKQSESTEIDDQNIIKEFENDLLSNTRSENASSGMKIENKILSRCLLDTEKNENYADTALNKKPCKNISDVVLQHRVDEKSCLKNHTERYTTKGTFVGFKTASNKQIDISEKALTKAKNIFDDLDFRELTSGDMNLFDEYKTLNIKDNKFFKEQYVERNDNKTKTGSELENTQSIKNLEKKYVILEKETPQFDVFQTAGKKTVKMSPEAVIKTKNLFEEMNISRIDVKDFSPEVGNALLKEFKTASNKPIKVSKEALIKTRNIFQDIDLSSEINENSHNNSTTYELHKNFEKQCFQNEPAIIEGSKPASNKNMNISDEDLTKSKMLFQNMKMIYDNDGHNDTLQSTFNKKRTIFSTEDNCDRYTKSESLFYKNQNLHKLRDKTLKGFKTSSNEQVPMSDEALAKNKKLFQDIEINAKYDEEKGVSELETAHNNLDFNDNNQFTKNIQISDQIFKGFKTASNKQVNISNEALAKSKKLFQDIEINDKFGEQNIISRLETVHNNQYFNDNSQFTKNIQISDQIFKGFQTASNKQVNISNEALAKSKKLFQDIKINDKFDEQNVISGLETVHNKPNFNDNSQFTKNIQISDQIFKGFQTASNKQVNISNEALAKSKKLFQDIENNDKYDEQKVISELETVHKKHNFNDNSQFTKISDQIFKSFQTASNKQVNISNEALAKSKKLFQDIEINCKYDEQKVISELETVHNKHNFNDNSQFTKISDQIFKGFQTASNKQVNISNEALAKSKKLFQDIEINCKYDEQKVISELETVYNKHNFNDNSQFTKISDQIFKGFQTASNKQVNISNDALAKSKKLLQDLDRNHEQNELNELTGNISHVKPINYGLEFRAANNNNINTFLESVTKSKKRKLDFNRNNEILKVQNKSIKEMPVNTKENINLDGIIDTQVLNNFEETLHTEDFCKETKHNKSKRSGSPILSCPRAKKRSRFAVPFKNEHKTTEEVTIKVISESSTNILFVFNESYKKTKKYTLKTLKTTETLNSSQNEIDQYILNFNFDNVLDFKFSDKRNELTDDQWSIEDLKKKFLSLVSRKIIPDGWLDNHLKLIILKLISYEIEYRDTMQGICSVKNVLQQLKYRYDRELYNVERPAFRKLLEKDDVSTRTMILRVLAIFVDGVAVTSISNGNNVELLVTDGWYCIKACLDQMLIKLVRDHKIRVGTKLATHGAELLNCEQGKAPWEDTSSVRLKLFGNSTRRAHWDARLGYHGAGAILAPLSCVELEGGKVSKLRALVTRVYPTLYVEKFEDGSTVTRSERLEQLHQMKYESERQALLEKIYEEVEKEFADEESQDSECDSEVRTSLNSGSQIKRFMKQCKDPGEFRAHLTSSQCALLQDYTNKRREKLLQSVQTRVEERLKAKGLHVGRNVVPVLKIRIADIGKNGEISKAMMSVWRPNDAILDIIQEGSWINVYNIVPTAMRYSEIQLSAGRQTIFSRTIFKENDKVKAMATNLKRTCYSTKDLAMNPMITTDYNEVDTVGLIFLIDPPSEQFESVKAQFQNVYLTDGEKNLICIYFWGGLKKIGYENVLHTCQVVACMNLQKRFGNTKKSIPQFRATEFSYFTKTSKLANVRKMTEELSKALSCVNIKSFCQECVEKKNNCSVLRNNCEKISPYRINYSDYNVSKHKMFIDSPLTRKPNPIEDILNLSGLDFESTFRQIDTQDISPSVLSRKKKVEEKIAKLKMYGEPPPLNPIHIINKSKNATSAFKSPLSSKNDTSNSVANEKSKDNTNVIVRNKQSSHVIYGENNCVKRKSANPIKLNFPSDVPEKENKGSQVVDPFAEEFDGSPPLSLD